MHGGPGMPGGCETCGEDGGPCNGPCGAYEGGPCCDDLFGLFRALPLHDRLYFRGEALLWWAKSADMPPLATTSPADTPAAEAGVLGQATTTVLFGDGVDLGAAPALVLPSATGSAPAQESGIEATYLGLGGHSLDFTGTPGTYLLRPIVNLTPGAANYGQNDVMPVAYPGGPYAGNLAISFGNELASIELLYRRAMFREGDFRLDFLAGYRYGWFSENLFIDEQFDFTGPPQDIQTYHDRFSADNRFNGAEFGFDIQTRSYRWSLDMAWKLALG